MSPLPTATTAAPGLWTRLAAHVARINAAHARQLRFCVEMDRASRDTGLPAEVLLNDTAHEPDLPFFLQSGFDRRD